MTQAWLPRWDARFMKLAAEAASWSKDPDEGVGAVVVAPGMRQFSLGYNGFPRGSCWDGKPVSKAFKNRLTIHAERNALDNASFDLTGATIYVTKAPCFECMKGIIQRGVVRVVHTALDRDSRWIDDQRDALTLAIEHGITCKEC